MIRTDKKDSNYVLVEYIDILLGISVSAKKNDDKTEKILNDLFTDVEEEDIMIGGNNYKRLKKDNEIVKYLKEECNVIDFDTFIDLDILSSAFLRSYYEFNYPMKKKLSNYFREFLNNEEHGIDNDYIKEEIKNDKELLKYIKKYDNLKDYVEKRINKNIDINRIINKKKIK